MTIYEIKNKAAFEMLTKRFAGLLFHRVSKDGSLYIKPLKCIENYVKPFAL